jgi:hypothetical protein
VQDAEGHRAAQAQLAARLALQARNLGLGLLDLQQAALAALEERPPDLGQTQPPRRAVQQARAESVLETRHILAHHRF